MAITVELLDLPSFCIWMYKQKCWDNKGTSGTKYNNKYCISLDFQLLVDVILSFFPEQKITFVLVEAICRHYCKSISSIQASWNKMLFVNPLFMLQSIKQSPWVDWKYQSSIQTIKIAMESMKNTQRAYFLTIISLH